MDIFKVVLFLYIITFDHCMLFLLPGFLIFYLSMNGLWVHRFNMFFFPFLQSLPSIASILINLCLYLFSYGSWRLHQTFYRQGFDFLFGKPHRITEILIGHEDANALLTSKFFSLFIFVHLHIIFSSTDYVHLDRVPIP